MLSVKVKQTGSFSISNFQFENDLVLYKSWNPAAAGFRRTKAPDNKNRRKNDEYSCMCKTGSGYY